MAEGTYRQALQQALREELIRDERVFLMGEEIGLFGGSYKITDGLLQEFGEKRVRDTPISEEGFLGAGIGAAMGGLRPVVEIMTINFILIAMDQIVNNAAKIRYMFGGAIGVPMVIRTPGGAGVGLTAQHSQSLEVWFASTPGLIVVAPSTPADAKGLLKASIRSNDPVLFYEHLMLYNDKGEIPDEDYVVPIGKAEIRRPGKDLTMISHSLMTQRSLKAAEELERNHGISAEVVDLRSLRPLDFDTIAASVRKTNHVLCIEEGWLSYGIGAEIAARVADECFDWLDAPVKRIGGAEVPMPYSKPLESAAMPSHERILEAAIRARRGS
ncbi:MAG: alpha-ketoacid dehydrogenase subunit beta [Chloroflexi bacterium]|nr:alpha-ketoacid dehydrogenase subunit beta [Chloroflexota bacterium]